MAQKGYITHTIKVGDSVQRLAVMYKLSDWRDIVYLNELEYPFIDDEIGSTTYANNEAVKKVGQEILIPANYTTAIPAQSNMAELEKMAYGSDLDIYNFTPENELVVSLEEKGELSDQDGDLRLSEGIANLKQRMIIRLSTSKGSLTLHPEFGSTLKNLVGLKATPQTLIKMRLEVQRCILSDSLIKGIKELNVDKQGGKVIITCIVVPIPPYKPFAFATAIAPE